MRNDSAFYPLHIFRMFRIPQFETVSDLDGSDVYKRMFAISLASTTPYICEVERFEIELLITDWFRLLPD